MVMIVCAMREIIDLTIIIYLQFSVYTPTADLREGSLFVLVLVLSPILKVGILQFCSHWSHM